jgi:DNA-binding response OmpR family regulator
VAHILVVSTRPAKSVGVVSVLRASGHHATFVPDFAAALKALDLHHPDLIITDLRLGAFNGLHLASRCQGRDPTTQAIVLDTADDRINKGEAERFHAAYFVEPVSDAEILAHVSRVVVTGKGPHRRWPRKHVPAGLSAQVARHPARVMDLSYGGFRIEVSGIDTLQPRFEVTLPSFGVAVRATSIWTRLVPPASMWCGAEISDATTQNAMVWRHIVDSVAAS